MASEKNRILQINAGSSNFGGVSAFLYNIYTHIDRTKIQFDFLSPNITTYGICRKEIEEMGGRIYELGITGNVLTRKLKLYRRLKSFLAEHNYSIVHINTGNLFFNLFAVKAAKDAGVKHRIVHSHNAGSENRSRIKRTLSDFLKPRMEKYATELYACSTDAAKYMFTRNTYDKGLVKIINNGISVKKYGYNPAMRACYRQELGIDNLFVVGNVGRLTPQKNHKYLLEIFQQIQKKKADSVLLLLGEGELEEDLKAYATQLGIRDNVLFLGVKKDAENYYQAMDVFLLPSLFEGLSISLMEAQTSGLPCFINETLSKDGDITDLIRRLSIEADPKVWSDEIVAFSSSAEVRTSHESELLASGYSIEDTASVLEARYLDMMEEK